MSRTYKINIEQRKDITEIVATTCQECGAEISGADGFINLACVKYCRSCREATLHEQWKQASARYRERKRGNI